MKYLNDSYTHMFEGIITDVVQWKDTKAIVLEETYFYPEGGGQPADHGKIDAVKVIDVQIIDDVIYHIADTIDVELVVGKKYTCHVDEKRRLALMQQHTGQHLLSACAYNIYSAQTVGFHIGDDYVTIDLDKKLTEKEVNLLESEVNAYVFSNREVKAHYPTPEALEKMPLRKLPKVKENIRVIEIDGLDFSPCGGTHVKSTAEIGLIKIKKVDNYKSGVRLEFVCGLFALETFVKQNELIGKLVQLYASQESEIYDYAVNNLNQLKVLRKENQLLENKCIENEVSALISGYEDISSVKLIRLKEENRCMNLLRSKVQMLIEFPNTLVIGHSFEGDKQHIVLAKSQDLDSNLKMNELFKKYLVEVGVKGGGNANVAQGGTLASNNLADKFDLMVKEVQSIIL